MQAVLNFSQEDKKRILEVLKGFEKLESKSQFEEARGNIDGCTITFYSSGKLLIQGNNAQAVKEKILLAMALPQELVFGIDETGRGENFGPLVIAGVLADKNKMLELRDSKKISSHQEKKKIVEQNAIDTFVVSVSAQSIDEMRAVGKNLNEIEAEIIDLLVSSARKTRKDFRVVVDGNPLPVKEENIEFLPKADDLNPVVGAASVLAKAIRDASTDKTKRKSWKNSLANSKKN